MTKDQFIVQTIIQLLSVLAAFLLAVIAIWGSIIKSKLSGPRLKLSLYDPGGERINTTGGTPTRYYHLRVENERRSSPAKNVRIVLTKLVRQIEQNGSALYSGELSGPVQFIWQHMGSVPQYPIVGPSMNCDLGCLMKDKHFALTLLFIPNNVDPIILPGQKIQIEALAISDETESNSLILEISWNGLWTEEKNEIVSHMVINEIKEITL